MMRRAKRKIREYHPLEELNIVPYLDVMVNLIIFLLVSMATVIPLGILSVYPPAASGESAQSTQEKTPENEKEKLHLSVFIKDDGFYIAGTGAVLPPIPKKGNEYDFQALTDKAEEIKKTFKDENKVIIAAEKTIRYEVLIKTMDALRNKGDTSLYPNVLLSPGIVGTRSGS